MSAFLATLPLCGIVVLIAVVLAAVHRFSEWAWKRSTDLEKDGRQ